MDTKLCVVCGVDLPVLRRSDRRYCGVRCRIRAHKIRCGVRPVRQASQPRAAGGLRLTVAAAAACAVATAAVAGSVAGDKEPAPTTPQPATAGLDAELQAQPQLVAESEVIVEQLRQQQEQTAGRLATLEAAQTALLEETAALRQQLADQSLQRQRLADQATQAQERIVNLTWRLDLANADRATLRSQLTEQAGKLATGEQQQAELRQSLEESGRAYTHLVGTWQQERAQRARDHALVQSERDELREQRRRLERLTEELHLDRDRARERCALLESHEAETKEALAATLARSLRRKQQLLQAREQIALLEDQYEDLTTEYSQLAEQLAHKYHRQLEAAERQYAQWAESQVRGWGAENERLRWQYDALHGDHERLRSDCRTLQGHVDEAAEVMARLEEKASTERQHLLQRQAAQQLAYPEATLSPPSKQLAGHSYEALEADETQERQSSQARRSGSFLRAAGLLAVGGAVGAMAGRLVSSANSQHRLAASSSPPALPGRSDRSANKALPPRR